MREEGQSPIINQKEGKVMPFSSFVSSFSLGYYKGKRLEFERLGRFQGLESDVREGESEPISETGT